MSVVSAYEAKTHFSELLARAEKGERVTITKHGRAVAQLVPVDSAKKMSVEEAIAGLRRFRKGRTLGGMSIKELINEGRKW
jgi:prevent-host-death family protein